MNLDPEVLSAQAQEEGQLFADAAAIKKWISQTLTIIYGFELPTPAIQGPAGATARLWRYCDSLLFEVALPTPELAALIAPREPTYGITVTGTEIRYRLSLENNLPVQA